MSELQVIVVAVFQLIFGLYLGWLRWGYNRRLVKRRAYQAGWNDALGVAKDAIRSSKAGLVNDG